jgi:formylglycine-generating enzyme required for sulfatase activity
VGICGSSRLVDSLFFANDPQWLPAYANIAAAGPIARGSKLPNRWGLFDMIGNAWEEVWDYDGPMFQARSL